jgi:hypothetical protein
MSAAAAELRAELERLDVLDARIPAGPSSLQTLGALEAGRQARVVRRAEILALLGEEDS